MTCENALQQLYFEGDCCSLIEMDGVCTLQVASGSCLYSPRPMTLCYYYPEVVDDSTDVLCATQPLTYLDSFPERDDWPACPSSDYNVSKVGDLYEPILIRRYMTLEGVQVLSEQGIAHWKNSMQEYIAEYHEETVTFLVVAPPVLYNPGPFDTSEDITLEYLVDLSYYAEQEIDGDLLLQNAFADTSTFVTKLKENDGFASLTDVTFRPRIETQVAGTIVLGDLSVSQEFVDALEKQMGTWVTSEYDEQYHVYRANFDIVSLSSNRCPESTEVSLKFEGALSYWTESGEPMSLKALIQDPIDNAWPNDCYWWYTPEDDMFDICSLNATISSLTEKATPVEPESTPTPAATSSSVLLSLGFFGCLVSYLTVA